jgi:cell division protease FtsH
MSRFFKSALFPILIVVVLAFFASKLISTGDSKAPPTYGDFITQLSKGQVKTVDLRTKDNVVAVTLKQDNKKYETGFTDDAAGRLDARLEQAKQQGLIQNYNVEPRKSSALIGLLTYVLPFVIFIAFWIFLMNQVQGGGSKVMSFGKSRAKRMSVDSPKITTRPWRSSTRSRSSSRTRRSSRRSGPAFPRACCCTALRAPARRCWRAPSPARPACRSSRSPARTSSRCSSA